MNSTTEGGPQPSNRQNRHSYYLELKQVLNYREIGVCCTVYKFLYHKYEIQINQEIFIWMPKKMQFLNTNVVEVCNLETIFKKPATLCSFFSPTKWDSIIARKLSSVP